MTKASSKLHDYQIEYEGKLWRLEIKKQQNLQWFDSGKHHLLARVDREILVLFVNHIKGSIDSLAVVRLGEFIDLLMSLRQYRHWGWTPEVMSIAAQFKIRYPALQFKAKAEILRLMRDHPDLFQVLYRRHNIVIL